WKKPIVYLLAFRTGSHFTLVYSRRPSTALQVVVPKYFQTCGHVLRLLPVCDQLYVVLLADLICSGQEKNLRQSLVKLANSEQRAQGTVLDAKLFFANKYLC